ncbi:MAG: DUF4911 domain-containing protein [Nitrospinota bacterium]|nr:DUF4911 domain-containing protein [Nitrospinota bacterium]
MRQNNIPGRTCFPAPAPGQNRRRVIFRVKPEWIAYVVMVIEAHDYTAIPRTIDQVNGVMEALCAPDYYQQTRSLIDALALEKDLEISIIAG